MRENEMKPKSLILMDKEQLNNVYGPDEIRQIRELTEPVGEPVDAADAAARPEILEDVEILFSGWGMCVADDDFLSRASRLKAVFYGAGSVHYIAPQKLFDRGILLTSAWAANAVPVAEFTFAQIILSLKKVHRFSSALRETGHWSREQEHLDVVPGGYGSVVGLVSLGKIGHLVLQWLKLLDVRVRVYDINLDEITASELGVETCSLEELFRTSDVVSLHTAFLPETRGMITGPLIGSMKEGATLINTARGGLIREEEMIRVLSERPDLTALLDVVYPEPPAADSPLFRMDNVFLTPHMAGSWQTECRRMGQLSVDECRRYLSGDPLQYRVTPEMLKTMA